jgi:hypothetical protein
MFCSGLLIIFCAGNKHFYSHLVFRSSGPGMLITAVISLIIKNGCPDQGPDNHPLSHLKSKV